MTEQQPPQPSQRRMINRKASRPARSGWIAKSADTPSSSARLSTQELAELFGADLTKAADKPSSSDLPAGAFSLKEHEQYLVSRHLDGIKNGEEVDFKASGKGAKLGKTSSGEPYLTTPASVARAEGEAWARANNVGQRRI